MSGPEDFLTRWARRKQEAAQAPRPPAETGAEAPAPERAPAAPIEEPILDLSTLPPIEEITATTDIRAYMAPGVPVELTRAALRRAWVTDPTIRDFIGIAENQWDFNDPHGVPGFGPLKDAGRLVAQFLGEEERRAARLANSPAPEAPRVSAAGPNVASLPDVTAGRGESAPVTDGQPQSPAQGGTNISAATKIVASQQPDPRQSVHAPIPRGHGGALPK